MPGKSFVCRQIYRIFWRAVLHALVTSGIAAQPGGGLYPTDRPLALSGKLRAVRGYGPPGWGENKKEDIQISYWVIDVSRTVRVQCPQYLLDQRDKMCDGTKRLRLVVVPDNLRAAAGTLQGKSVVANGFLRLQKYASDFTPVYMEVIDLKPRAHTGRRED